MNDAIPLMRSTRLRSVIVADVHEAFCTVMTGERLVRARYATHFPTPRVQRLSPGHLVAVVTAPNGDDVVVWRWYDAVVVGEADHGQVRLWEPAHGDVVARLRRPDRNPRPGTRSYLSAGLPGAQWWVAGPAVTDGAAAEVELDEVERLYTDNDMWHTVI